QVRVIDQTPQIALEQAMVGGVEANQCHEQPDVGLGHALAKQKGSTLKTPLEFVEHLEHVPTRFVVRLLRRGKTSAIDSVVEFAIDRLIERFDLAAQMGWI